MDELLKLNLRERLLNLQDDAEKIEELHNEHTGARNGDEWFDFKQFIQKMLDQL